MSDKETERRFLSVLGEYLVSLPYDLKLLQEAVDDMDLDRAAREMAAGTLIHTFMPQEGDRLLCYVDDVLLLRATMALMRGAGGDAFEGLRGRYSEAYDRLDDELAVFKAVLGDSWEWLTAKLEGFARLVYKGRRPAQYVDDEDAQSFLYDELLEFETNYNVTEDRVKNRLRRVDVVVDLLDRRRADEAMKIT